MAADGMTAAEGRSHQALGRDFFSTDEIRALAERSDLWGWWLVAHCWGTIALALGLFGVWPNPLTFVLAVVIIGSRQLGLAILMHEAAHNALFGSRRLNDWVGEWLCGRPILADLAEYRRYHLKHHRHTQTEDDPDLVLSKPFPTTRASLRRKLWRDITGRTGIKQRSQQIMFALKMAGEVEGQPGAQDLAQAFSGPVIGRAIIANAVLFAVMWAVGAWWWWLAFWVLPLLTWFQLVLRIRNIAEHGAVEAVEDPLRNTRTTKAGPLARLLVAPYWVNYHLEHHLVMHVPARNLPRLHRMLVARGHAARMQIAGNYWDVLRIASSRTG
ncbi:MAG: fatty acid desaturase family protein [Paracoccaceae bacterium]|nr:fatty acid desaturase family protein [Paracoccaceae bacterium]